jgi:F0F1-type ATP synthase alpha subunit
MLEMMELKHASTLAAIAEKKELTDEIASQLKIVLKEFTDSFKSTLKVS